MSIIDYANSKSHRERFGPRRADVERLAKPVGSFTIVCLVFTCAGLAFWALNPSSGFLEDAARFLALIIVFGGAVVRCLMSLLLNNAVENGRSIRSGRIRTLAVGLTSIAFIYSMMSNVPERIMFAASHSALDRFARQATQLPEGTKLPNQRLGWYWATEIESTGSGISFHVWKFGDDFSGLFYPTSGNWDSQAAPGSTYPKYLGGGWYSWHHESW